MISPQERALCTTSVQSAFLHLEARDAAALRLDLAALKDVFIYSDYPFWKQWGEAKPRIVRLLFEALPVEEFLTCYEGRNFFAFEIWRSLDEIVGEIPISQLQILCERFGFPGPKTAPLSFDKLVEAADDSFSLWLSLWINRYFEEHREDILRGFWSSNHFSDALLILARRSDALGIVAPMLREMRFGTTLNSANYALLEGLGARTDEAARQLLVEWGNGGQSIDFRLLLLDKIAGFAPEQALKLALSDLVIAREASDIESFLRWLDKNSSLLEESARHLNPALDTSRWSAVSSATLAAIWAEKYPFWPLSTSPQTRLVLRAGRHLHRLREFNIGCAPLIFGIPTLGALWLMGLNTFVGMPAYSLRWIERWPGLAWTDLVLLLIVWPLFSGGQIWQGPHGMESVRENWESVLFFYGGMLAFLLGTALVRMWPLTFWFEET